MELSQRIRWFGWQSFALLEDKIVVRVHKPLSTTEFSAKFNEIVDSPTRMRRVGATWFIGAAGLFVGAASYAIYVLPHAIPDVWLSEVALITVLAVAGGTCLARAISQTFDVVMFQSRQGRISIRYNKPDPESFRSFVQALQTRVSASFDIEKRTTLSVLEWLRSQEFLDEGQFKEAKRRLRVEDQDNQ